MARGKEGKHKRSPSLRKKGKSPPKTSQPSASFIYRGKKKKSVKRKLTPLEVRMVIDAAALRDYVRTEKISRPSLTYGKAFSEEKFQDAIKALAALRGPRTLSIRKRATEALKILGRLAQDFKGIYKFT